MPPVVQMSRCRHPPFPRNTVVAHETSAAAAKMSRESFTSPDSGATSFSPSVLAYLTDIFDSNAPESTTKPKDCGRESSRGGTKVSAEAFVRAIQGGDLDPDTDNNPLLHHDWVGLHEFLVYMASGAADAFARPGVSDLLQPMCDYFVNSSHNTYITGNQLTSKASVEPYRNALLRGCRCIEIDVWDGISSAECPNGPGPERDKAGRQSTPKPDSHQEKKVHSRSRGIRGNLSGSSLAWLCRVPRLSSNHFSSTTKRSSSGPPNINAVSMPSAKRREPRVVHGPSLSKGVPFRDVCHAIRETAFVSSDLPVIISLEVHASPQQQEVMVEIMQEVWQEFLVDIDSMNTTSSGTLPSPHELRRKLLIKVKGPPLDYHHAESGQTEDGQGPKNSGPGPMRKVIDLLSSLAVYTQGYSFRDFSQPEASLPTHIFSLSEAAIRKLHKNDADVLFAHNRSFLMRVFPAGRRVDSSNFNPCFFWRQGIQMVVMNWQRLDRGMMLNQGMFADESGWVLKPEGYRSDAVASVSSGGGKTPVTAEDSTLKRRSLSLTLTLFAGQNIQPPATGDAHDRMKPYVTCDLHLMIPSEKTEKTTAQKPRTYKRRSEPSKGPNPDFQRERLCFPRVSDVAEELSFLRLKVKSCEVGKDRLIAFACVRLDRLLQGYRFIRLFDDRGVRSEGRILVKVEKGALSSSSSSASS
ncbi:hypothetical protein PV04_03562 [Phialophora macrospora]|uniref:Phosphoinositide phospholipase C n=1 Tax=Phialophora macrospora TaxID=1851006 RepID=A0A0D2D1Q1_9EURO|nr:hypothetical protein PV04_03562 [Phialophora macrospora]